ncbi:hypothetical protein HDV05_000910 [Chytridiales sp. JEL 0842]|nr:hypothetical protein HDV05_000910 [Chytridiales sp. JEL 0842]
MASSNTTTTTTSGPESLITQVQPPPPPSAPPPNNLITQVSPNATNASPNLSNLITQVPDPSADNATSQQPRTIPQPSNSQQQHQQQQQHTPKIHVHPQTPLTPVQRIKHFLTTFCCCCLPFLRNSNSSNSENHELTPTKKPQASNSNASNASGSNGPVLKTALLPGKRGSAIQPEKKHLLPPLAPAHVNKKCLVLDLDETLVHSSFKPVPSADFIIPVEIDGQTHNVYVLKRPGVDLFLQRLGRQFEVVVFTASLSKYADPVLDTLDKHQVVHHRLFREACIHHRGNYVKDLSLLGRDLKDVIILDNSPASYIFHPSNAIPISSWFNDPNDTELVDLIPFLEDLKLVEDVRSVLASDTGV